MDEQSRIEPAAIGARARGFCRDISFLLALFVVATLPISTTFGAGERPIVNDVGRGAFIWGTSDEITTYSEPYYAYKTPTIYRIPTNAIATTSAPANDKLTKIADKLGDVGTVGTIFGTDGKLYEYYYVKGVEPRRVVETQRVRERPENALAPIWVDKTVERIEWEPVLIRVLRPAGSNARDAAALAPSPGEPLSAAEETASTDAAATSATPATDPTSLGDTPPALSPSSQPQTNDSQNSSVVSGVRQPDGSITLNLDRSMSQTRPLVVLPQELRRR